MVEEWPTDCSEMLQNGKVRIYRQHLRGKYYGSTNILCMSQTQVKLTVRDRIWEIQHYITCSAVNGCHQNERPNSCF